MNNMKHLRHGGIVVAFDVVFAQDKDRLLSI